MKTKLQKKSQAPLTPFTQGKKAGHTTIADNRPEAMVQRKLAEAIQRQDDDEELKQGKFIQRAEDEEELQGKFTVQRSENKTGMSDNLKAGVEQLSGLDMSDVRVHYNSSKPAQVQAHAYTQGANIHVAPGQEQHLPHEAWHVAQQKQGRVQPTTEVAGMPVNDNPGLEKEADVMGHKAANGNHFF
ncbi:DUF4157 domain-containing protein [Marinilabiliaceae bacterium JC017]|nr:DUF4157 domain-containing protein [Marinilabiliaceae bacterium JC017]